MATNYFSVNHNNPLPASPSLRGRSLSGPFSPVRLSLKEPGGSRQQKARTIRCGLGLFRADRAAATAYLLPVPELRVEEVGLRRAVVLRARGSLPCISL